MVKFEFGTQIPWFGSQIPLPQFGTALATGLTPITAAIGRVAIAAAEAIFLSIIFFVISVPPTSVLLLWLY
ncbi:hypothetical protein MBRU_00805 [Mycolicibacterium brumae DSM 44177]|nr:hypothetical protein MBRU_00805 [Mycolicibacterium brumae DSM 44177]